MVEGATDAGCVGSEVGVARTARQRVALERLRYRVYCEEKGWLSAAEFPEGREQDEFDARSVHFVAYREGVLVGTSRLVLSGPFPLEPHCTVQRRLLEEPGVAEVSRLVVAPAHRRAPLSSGRELAAGAGARPVTFELLLAMLRYSVEHGVHRWIAAMEPTLRRLLSVAGLAFEQIGPSCDYFGPVAPYSARVGDLVRALAPREALAA